MSGENISVLISTSDELSIESFTLNVGVKQLYVYYKYLIFTAILLEIET